MGYLDYFLIAGVIGSVPLGATIVPALRNSYRASRRPYDGWPIACSVLPNAKLHAADGRSRSQSQTRLAGLPGSGRE